MSAIRYNQNLRPFLISTDFMENANVVTPLLARCAADQLPIIKMMAINPGSVDFLVEDHHHSDPERMEKRHIDRDIAFGFATPEV